MIDWKRFTARNFDLKLTLESGQFFRFREVDEEDGYFVVLTAKTILLVKQDGDRIYYSGADEGFVRNFLGLSGENDAALSRLKKDPVISSIVERYGRLRIMNIDLHETIIGFICSSQSNIPKIKMNLELISRFAGESVGGEHFLPRPGAELDESVLVAAKTGYRAKFIARTNKMLSEKRLSDIDSLSYEESHAALCEFPGVGPKIADCVCLFALGHGEAFPVDVHVLRAMRRLFPKKRFKNESAAKEFARERWGKDAGLAQQLIYQWARYDLA